MTDRTGSSKAGACWRVPVQPCGLMASTTLSPRGARSLPNLLMGDISMEFSSCPSNHLLMQATEVVDLSPRTDLSVPRASSISSRALGRAGPSGHSNHDSHLFNFLDLSILCIHQKECTAVCEKDGEFVSIVY